ncbi:MAG: hypothetical protein HY255_03775 [Betaproteobacteria bacterium]|nr:hypothetical protein [Betaproteobacteria bacterium]
MHAMNATAIHAKPVPPRKPDPQECCGTGCIPCVMDLYEEELWQYEKDLRAWQATNATPQWKAASGE